MNIIKKITLSFVLAAVCTLFCSVSAFAGLIVIDPGHGGPGTQGCGALYPPYMEKSLTLEVSNKIKNELQAAGIPVTMTRTSDRPMSLDERAAFAKSQGASLLISIHFNASGPHDKTGSEVWSSMYGNHHLVGTALGSQILSQMTALGFESKGIKTKVGSQGDYFGIIRNGVANGVPTVIVEQCFLDYPADRSILETKGTDALAHANAVGIINFLNSPTGQSLMNGSLDVSPVNIATTPITAKGTVGASAQSSSLASNFTPAQWSWLMSQWEYTGHPLDIINSMPLSELQALVQKHEQGLI